MERITVNEAISYFDEICPNQISRENKIKWLSELDEKIYNEIIKTRRNPIITEFVPYGTDDGGALLLVGTPHTEIYRYWLDTKIRYIYHETDRYNVALVEFQDCYDEFFRQYNREHGRADYNRWTI